MIASVAIVLAVSCTAVIEQENIVPERTVKELTITARTEAGIDTKTELSQTDGSVLWTPGDAISLFYGSGTDGGSCFTSTATENTAITNFTGTIDVISGGADISPEETYFWGMYPYSSDASCDGTSVTMSLSSQQTAVAGTFAPGASPSLGRSRSLSMGFYNICGGVKFSVTYSGINKVTLRSKGGELIAGTAKVVFDDSGHPEVQEIISGTDAISLEAPEGEYFEVGEYYYIMMFPTEFSSGFTLTLETLTESTTVEKNGDINIGRSFFGRMQNVDNNAIYTTKPEGTSGESDLLSPHLAFSSDNEYTAYGNCGLGTTYKDLYLSADDPGSISCVSIVYNSGSIDLLSLIEVHAIDASTNEYRAYSPEEILEYYPDLSFTFEIVHYYMNHFLTSEGMYGKIEGSTFYPCYVKSQGGGQPFSVVITEGDNMGMAAIGHAPLILVSLVNDETGDVCAYGYFRIFLTR